MPSLGIQYLDGSPETSTYEEVSEVSKTATKNLSEKRIKAYRLCSPSFFVTIKGERVMYEKC